MKIGGKIRGNATPRSAERAKNATAALDSAAVLAVAKVKSIKSDSFR